jgi:hypothetical protein
MIRTHETAAPFCKRHTIAPKINASLDEFSVIAPPLLEAYLLAVVEVEKEKSIICQAAGCGHAVFKRIHVVKVGSTFQVLGSECFKRIYGNLDTKLVAPQYGSWNGRRLTDDERLALVENTGRFIERLEAERAEFERMEALRIEAKRLEDERRLAIKRQYHETLTAAKANRNNRFVVPEKSAINQSHVPDNERMQVLLRDAKVKLRAQHPGIDVDSPGWSGLVLLEVRKMLKQAPVIPGDGELF